MKPMTPSTTSTTTSTRLDWVLFVLLGFLWGSSYLFIKIGVDAGLQPFTLVSLRLLIGLLMLAVVVGVAREAFPREPRMYGHLVVMGFFSVALPFMLITWAETSVDSSLAAVLTATVPLFIIPITWFIGGKKPAPPSREAAKQSPLLIEEIAADASRPRNDRM